MRWFKHMTSANRNEELLQLRDEFGVAGYGIYWIILELIGEKISEKNETFLKLSKKNWRNFCEFSPKKFQKFLKTCSKLGLFSVEIDGDFITVDCPKLLKYRDEWTKRNQRRKAKNSGVTPEQLRCKNTDTDTDTDIYKPPISPLQKKLIKKITDIQFTKFQDKIIEFFKYRMSFPKAKRYKTEKGLDGLLRDITGCISAGLDPVECLNIAMEREWLTPSPEYFKNGSAWFKSNGDGGHNGTNFSENDDREATDFPARDLQIPIRS